MGGRGYLNYIQTVHSQQQKVAANLSQLETTFLALKERSSEELFRLADQQAIPSKNAIDTNNTRPPSLLSGIESIYYLDKNGTILGSSAQDGTSIEPSHSQITSAVNTLNKSQRPIATLSCTSQCYQSVFIPIIANDGRELIININRSAALLIQDFYEITGGDIALFTLSPKGETFASTHIIAASHAKKMNVVLTDILKLIDFSTQNQEHQDFYDSTTTGYYSARLFPLNQSDGIGAYAAIIEDQSHLQGLLIQAMKDIGYSTLITLALILLLISLILKPSLDRLMKLATILPMLPKSQFQAAKQLLQLQPSSKKYADEIDILQYTLGDVIESLEHLSASVEQHREELKSKIDALTEAKLFTELILDASPLAVIIHDTDGTIRNINKMGRELTRLELKEPINANINTWVRNENQSKPLSATLKHITDTTGKKSQGQMPFFTEDGRKLYFLWTHTTIYVNNDINVLSMGMDITERQEAAESLHWLGEHDRITGLLNRTSFTDLAKEYIAQHCDDELIELVMFDIDDFAIFNDRFGFDAGDNLLNDLASYLVTTLPDNTPLARTGSGEFCAIIHHPKSTKQSAINLGLEKLTRYTFNQGSISEDVCVSIVIDSYDDSLSGIDELISNTTSTMVKVKNKVRGSLYYAAESNDSSQVSRHQKYRMKEQLQAALSANRLVLFFQPILDLSTNSVSHCECLVRMLDSEGQFISPAHFLGIAAESGLMPRLDYSVMEKAMRQQRSWEDEGIHTGLSINITAPTLEQADFEARLAEILERTGANPERLIFEIVETDTLENLSTARNLLNNFKAVGAKIAFDDFGIGFTSFEYVRELPVDYIKIDQAFIRFIHERESDQVLVKSMVEMSHKLGKKVIVEGVENRKALEIVRDMGVEYVQGYYVCRPMPISALDLSLKIHDF